MKIKFVGTACMISNDNPACFIVDDNILIDIPNGCHKVIRSNKIQTKINHLLITHTHADHVFDIPFLLLSKYVHDEKVVIHTTKKNAKALRKIIKLGFPTKYYEMFLSGLFTFDYSKCFDIDDKKIEMFPVKHGTMDAYGYKITKDKESIVFTGDTGMCNNLLEKLTNINAIVCDCTYEEGMDKHMGVDNIEYFLNGYQNMKVIPIHVSPKSLEKLKGITNNNLIIPKDLDEVIID